MSRWRTVTSWPPDRRHNWTENYKTRGHTGRKPLEVKRRLIGQWENKKSSLPHWFRISWWGRSCSWDLLPWENSSACVSLPSAVAVDYQQRKPADRRWESWEHRRTNLLLSLVRDKQKQTKNPTIHLSTHTKTFSKGIIVYVCVWGVTRHGYYPTTWRWSFRTTQKWATNAGQRCSGVFWA